ncbi:hypothetical protein GDO81_003659 [Engystomops pustulosus]|uniref:Ig-like domain-containing protein n=1 Tax=Engystomops pustulosus TaxID=76066 RepID=A0AAV7A7B5_ENGPU|nr:hypothetical protein GDO81_003659 [Engystomops pustulosus]
MANDRILGHIKWLSVFAICFSGRNAFCDLSLNMKETMTGVRSQSVVIPCKYTAPKDYSEHKVEWSLDSEVIIHRVESEDHIPLTKFRERVEISKAPDDVSLTMRKLSVTDKGNIKCKVTWKKKDGTLVSNEDITVLKVVRVRPTTEKPQSDIIITTPPEHQTKISESDDGSHISTATTMETIKSTAIVNFHESTTLISMYTTELFFNNAEIAHNKGWGISFYTLLIIIMCVLCIMTVVIVLIINKKKRKGNVS